MEKLKKRYLTVQGSFQVDTKFVNSVQKFTKNFGHLNPNGDLKGSS
jgi:hypothetical protein